jgi:hypothetical protein
MSNKDNKIWYVCHGDDTVHFVGIAEGSTVISGQPNIEEYTNEEEAVARATALGYVFEQEEL